MSVGDRIKSLREKKQWSQLFLSEKLGIHNSVLSRIEAGKRPIEDELLAKISDIFDVSVDYLLGRTDHPKGIILQGKTGEEKRKIYQEFVIEKANEPLKYKGKPLNQEQLEKLNKILDAMLELSPEQMDHLIKTLELTLEGFNLSDNKKET